MTKKTAPTTRQARPAAPAHNVSQSLDVTTEAGHPIDSRWPLANLRAHITLDIAHGTLDLSRAANDMLDVLEKRAQECLTVDALAWLEMARRHVSSLRGEQVHMATVLGALAQNYLQANSAGPFSQAAADLDEVF